MTPLQRTILEDMDDTGEEIVCEGTACYIGTRRISRNTVNALLRSMTLRDTSDTKGLTRFVINDTGRAILRRPALEFELAEILTQNCPFKIVDDQIVQI